MFEDYSLDSIFKEVDPIWVKGKEVLPVSFISSKTPDYQAHESVS